MSHITLSLASAPSAIRADGQDYRDLALKFRSKNKSLNVGTAHSVTVAYQNFKMPADLEEWDDQAQITQAFERGRDERFISFEHKNTSFPRRSTWLYPDDGCFTRAELFKENMSKWKYPKVYKLFVFGNLKVATKNSASGSVRWWYHVVSVASLNGTLVVFDPAIEPVKSLPVEDWLATMSTDIKTLEVSLCESNTYAPSSKCANPRDRSSSALSDQTRYLSSEWRRLVSLSRDPEVELGATPPWK
jgi:hypothetical protein